MKFIHISDLHLGKRLKEFSLIEDQNYILKQILTIVKEEKPDGVLIAGDVYDRSVPSEEAMQLWDSFLVRLAELKVPVYAISGNHDSSVRFSDHGQLVETTGIHLSPVYNGTVKKYSCSGSCGEVNIYLLPFIKPASVRPAFPDEEIVTYTDACRVAIEHMDVDTSKINILVAHQFVTGAERCDSEEVSVGGLDNVDVSVFDPFDYVALGHIHGKQHMGRKTVRYCGTPLKYSFSEKDHKKTVTVVEIGGKDSIDIREIPLKPMHDLREIRGSYNELMSKDFYEGTDTRDYIRAVLTDEEEIIDGMAKLRIVYPNIMYLEYDNRRTQSDSSVSDAERVEEKSPLELFEEFYEKQNNQPLSSEQHEFITGLIGDIWG